ncbi:uncharacterized protein UBRO2_01585 [Ustilago bromivora]|uniref:Transmembrane protein n=1 Tax=Ustilago bromivora TaxID=307758 RepID=A0A8H8QKC5_9BASI|nr:uncharacterized protein UBRO2_01585 [Ustilago bromivora]
MPNIFAPPHLPHMWGLPDFPLADNATAQQVMTLMDSLALKIHPEGYWQLSWVTSVSNVIIFLFIAMAMRIYRSQKSPVPLWLFKLEQRPYKVWRRRKSKSNPNRKARFWKPFRSSIPNATSAPEKATATTDASNTDRGEESETQMGSFITASCVNCHLVLTSGYVLLFFVRVIEGYVTRDAFDSPPLIEPFMIDAVMQAAIFSTAYFAALGYIAILLPNIPPWIWNNTVISVYATTILVGLVCLISIAASASKINYYRTLVYNDLFTLPSLFNSISTMEGTVNSAAIQLARAAYKEAMDQRVWFLGAHGLVSIGGILLSLAYLLIFVTLTKKVAGELVQLRHEPPQDRGHALSSEVGNNVVTTWPSAAVPYSAPAWQPNTSLAQPNRFSLPLRMAVRTPPPTPAPKGPLPLPPARTPTSPTWRFSASDSIGHGTREVIAHASTPMLRAKSSMSSITDNNHATMEDSVGGLASMQGIKREEEEEGDVVAMKGSSAPVRKIVAAVKVFHPRPTSPSSTATLPKPTEDQPQANGLGLFSTIVKHTPFSSLLTGSNRPSSFPFATQTAPEPNPTYPKSSTEVTQRPTKGRQLVLDSLISSHALPIQGFYCHHSTAASNSRGVGLNMLQVNEMVELGLTPSRYEAALPCQNAKQQQEVEEELQPLPSTTPTSTSRGVWMGEESNQRRQKFRQQFRAQVVQEAQILSPLSPTCLNVADGEQESTGEGGRARSSSCLTRGNFPISPKTPTTPNPIQEEEEKDREQSETHISLPLSPFPPSEESQRSTSSDNAFLKAYKTADSVGGNKDEEEEEEEEEGTFGGSF